MLKSLGSRLTYANVVATGALFVALGGGAYALSGVPDRGGVFHGCVDPKAGGLRVVKSASSCRKTKTVRRGRRRVRIPDESAIAWNQQGRPGIQGLQGLQGGQGVQSQKGDTGATGPSDIHAVGVGAVTISNTSPTEVASLTVPAGSYLLGASLSANKAGGGDTGFGCLLGDSTSPTLVWDGQEHQPADRRKPAGNLTLAGADTFNAATTIKLVCTQTATAQATDIRLWAINTGDLHATLPLPIAG